MTTQSAEHTLEIRFVHFFKQYEYRLYSLALTLTKSDQYAKDIVQDVFLKLWGYRHQMHSIPDMETWLYRLTENRIMDFLRKTASDRRLRAALWTNMQRNFGETEEFASLRDYGRIIEKAISQLPPQRQRIYRLSTVHGLDYRQIARELDIPRHSIKKQLFSAVQSVRKFFATTTKLFF
ncbi:MAG: sigma-70 family RNA polymerase sigma factor [Chitinophagaceae bacterium]|nr:sigma-70 family RNA polymerase sigma factor [Chitinophagaceae bacterium]